MWPWLEFVTTCLIAIMAGGSILGVVIIVRAMVADWLRERGDAEFRCEIREWEQELGRKMTRGERAALAHYRIS